MKKFHEFVTENIDPSNGAAGPSQNRIRGVDPRPGMGVPQYLDAIKSMASDIIHAVEELHQNPNQMNGSYLELSMGAQAKQLARAVEELKTLALRQ